MRGSRSTWQACPFSITLSGGQPHALARGSREMLAPTVICTLNQSAGPNQRMHRNPRKPRGFMSGDTGAGSAILFVSRDGYCVMLKTLSLVGYIGMIGGLLGLLAMHAVFSTSAWVIAIQVAALLVAVWARVTFGRRSFHVAANPTKGGLVTWGPYRYIRHPIYTAICVATIAGIAAHWSWKGSVLGNRRRKLGDADIL